MLLRLSEPSVDLSHPFSTCKLGRENQALILSDIIKSYQKGFILAIDNEWGTGKTTFVKMWKQHLVNNGFKTLYFNAWENDSESEIFITLISELKELQETKSEKAFKQVLSNATPLANSLIKGIIKTLVEKHIGNEFSKQAITLLGDSVVDNIEERVDAYLNRKNDKEKFKKSLESYVSKVSENLPVIFIIDELDRCRPSYAVELLEQIKHLFNVEGIVFVLSIDKVQLGNAIRGFYGSDTIAANEYLRRFIDIEFSLPKPDTKAFCEHLYESFQFEEFLESLFRREYNAFKNDARSLVYFSSVLFKANNLPLRVQEKILGHARLSLMTFNKNQYLFPSVYVLLITLRSCFPSIYSQIRNLDTSLQVLLDNLIKIFPTPLNDNESRIVLSTLALLIISYNNSRGLNKEIILSRNTDIVPETNIHIPESETFTNEIFRRALQMHSENIEIADIESLYLIEKIELTDSIKL